MTNYFNEKSSALKLQPITSPNSGFRPGQLGAMHSVISHFSVYEDPAIVTLPTGYGKTAVIMALPFVLGSKRVLLVEPSDVLRKQTSQHFETLSTLRKLSVISNDLPNPNVKGQKGRLSSKQEWQALNDFDVVVSTPQSTSPLLPEKSEPDLFDLIIFDEAHHAPADTWAAYLQHYRHAKFVFLTATPFRRDKKAIPGRIAYTYPVSKASAENAFGVVKFKAAEVEDTLDHEHVDRAIAKAAAQQLASDKAAGFDHRIFVRAASIKSAKALVELYTAEGVTAEAVSSGIAKSTQDRIEERLRSGDLDAIVCVDMFGEGYDFPKLKIAALHAPHRSLVPTIQFIGRFARTNDDSTGDAVLIAPIHRLQEASAKLFKDGVDIATLIDTAAQVQIAGGNKEREILETLKLKKQAETDYEAVSPLSLKLYAHAQIFKCTENPDLNKFQTTLGRSLKLAKQWISEDNLITLIITVDYDPPNWATSDVIANIRHDAFLIAFNEATELCYIGSTRRTSKLYLEIMETICPGKYSQISFEETRRAVAGLNDLRFYNVGLKNTAINTQGESYRVYTGPRAERAVTTGDSRAYVQGHFFGSGTDGDERETIGASSSSRVWSNKRLTVREYLDWVTLLNNRLNSDESIGSSQLDLIQHSRRLTVIPNTILGATWDKTVYRKDVIIRYRNNTPNWVTKRLIDMELANFHVNNNQLTFDIVDENQGISFEFSINGGQLIRQRSANTEFEVQTQYDEWLNFASWLSGHPPLFFASDKSSFQGINAFPAPTNVTSQLADGSVITDQWVGCAITDECETNNPNGLISVHDHLERKLSSLQNIHTLLYDHRSGEAADFILITNENDEYEVVLYHCKGAGGQPSGGRVNDVYEVTCQMLKSVSFCDTAVLKKHIKHRTDNQRHRNPSRFVIGNLTAAEELLTSTPANKIRFSVVGVQPGISQAAINNHLSDLMAFSLDYIVRGGAASGKWLVSP